MLFSLKIEDFLHSCLSTFAPFALIELNININEQAYDVNQDHEEIGEEDLLWMLSSCLICAIEFNGIGEIEFEVILIIHFIHLIINQYE